MDNKNFESCLALKKNLEAVFNAIYDGIISLDNDLAVVDMNEAAERFFGVKSEDVTGKAVDCLHIVGGGMQNELLNQFAANATGKKVIAGPAEATATGNILMQAKATRQIKTLAEAREIVRHSFELKVYHPQEASLWKEQYKSI